MHHQVITIKPLGTNNIINSSQILPPYQSRSKEDLFTLHTIDHLDKHGSFKGGGMFDYQLTAKWQGAWVHEKGINALIDNQATQFSYGPQCQEHIPHSLLGNLHDFVKQIGQFEVSVGFKVSKWH